jgi:hypothetical protein
LDKLREILSAGVICKSVYRNRYLDVGDWQDGYAYTVKHSDSRSEAGVLIHELAEKLLCDFHGVSPGAVDLADRRILKGKLKKNQAVYWRWHLVALRIERLLVEAMGLDWGEHERNVNEAFEKQRELMSGMKAKGGKGGKAMKKMMEKMAGKKKGK